MNGSMDEIEDVDNRSISEDSLHEESEALNLVNTSSSPSVFKDSVTSEMVLSGGSSVYKDSVSSEMVLNGGSSAAMASVQAALVALQAGQMSLNQVRKSKILNLN